MKVIIIGGGVAGLTAGIYAQQNGFESVVYEKHSVVGGQCTGWERKGCYIDGCVHWLTGTNPASPFYPLWKNVGVLGENIPVYDNDSFGDYLFDGHKITLWGDLEKLRRELTELAPEDEKEINRLINAIRAYKYVTVPTEKPLDMLNIFQLTALGFPMLRVLPYLMKYRKMDLYEYGFRFKNPAMRKMIQTAMSDGYTVHSFLYVMSTMATRDGGIPVGGSVAMIEKMRQKYMSLGGEIYVNAAVKSVVIDNNRAVGVQLTDESVHYSDYVLSSTDVKHTIDVLLEGKYKVPEFEMRFANPVDYPASSCFLVAMKTFKDVSFLAKSTTIEVEPYSTGFKLKNSVCIRNYFYDSTMKTDGATVLSSLVCCSDGEYEYWKKLNCENKAKYKARKKELAASVCDRIKSYFPQLDDLEVIDVTTPVTYEKYLNAYHGSYMAFVSTARAKILFKRGDVKGLKNFYMCGQWMMPPGGLPVALFSGKHAIARVCAAEKLKFYTEKTNSVERLRAESIRRKTKVTI